MTHVHAKPVTELHCEVSNEQEVVGFKKNVNNIQSMDHLQVVQHLSENGCIKPFACFPLCQRLFETMLTQFHQNKTDTPFHQVSLEFYDMCPALEQCEEMCLFASRIFLN